MNHGRAKEVCRSRETHALPIEIRNFASLFVDLQEKRHLADYGPVAVFCKSEVERFILDSRDVLREFEKADRRERKSFAAPVLFRSRN